jgi:hypothetical protein
VASPVETTVTSGRQQASELELRFKDPRTEPLLANTFPELFPTSRSRGPDSDRQIMAMAQKQAATDKAVLAEYVRAQVAALTSHKNIAAMLDQTAPPTSALAIDEATTHLVSPILASTQANNISFRNEFTRAIMAVAPEAFRNHLYARIGVLLPLSRSGDPVILPALQAALDDPAQPIALKVLAAVGIGEIARGGRWADSNPVETRRAARSLAGALERERNSFWPMRLRVIEALGRLRLASSDLESPKGDFAAVVMKTLADPTTTPPVRAAAAEAFSLVRPNEQLKNYNLGLAAYYSGQTALGIVDDLLKEPLDATDSTTLTPYLARAQRAADLLLRLNQAFEGDPDQRGSGLKRIEHADASSHQETNNAIAAAIREAAAAAVELSSAVPALAASRRSRLEDAQADLKKVLEANVPKNFELFAGGPSFPLAAAEPPKPAEPAKAAEPGKGAAPAEAPKAAPSEPPKATEPAKTKSAPPRR